MCIGVRAYSVYVRVCGERTLYTYEPISLKEMASNYLLVSRISSMGK